MPSKGGLSACVLGAGGIIFCRKETARPNQFSPPRTSGRQVSIVQTQKQSALQNLCLLRNATVVRHHDGAFRVPVFPARAPGQKWIILTAILPNRFKSKNSARRWSVPRKIG